MKTLYFNMEIYNRIEDCFKKNPPQEEDVFEIVEIGLNSYCLHDNSPPFKLNYNKWYYYYLGKELFEQGADFNETLSLLDFIECPFIPPQYSSYISVNDHVDFLFSLKNTNVFFKANLGWERLFCEDGNFYVDIPNKVWRYHHLYYLSFHMGYFEKMNILEKTKMLRNE